MKIKNYDIEFDNRKALEFLKSAPKIFMKAFTIECIKNYMRKGIPYDALVEAGAALLDDTEIKNFIVITRSYRNLAEDSLPYDKKYYLQILTEIYDNYFCRYLEQWDYVAQYSSVDQYIKYLSKDFLDEKKGKYSEEGFKDLSELIPSYLLTIVHLIKLDLEDNKEFQIAFKTYVLGELNKQENNNASSSVHDSTKDIKKLWTNPAFLDKQSEINLSDIYIKPYYFDDKEDFINNNFSYVREDIDERLNSCLEADSDKRMLTVLGYPGMGKTTLISYILNNFDFEGRTVRTYCLRNFSSLNWAESEENLPDLMLSHLGLTRSDLSSSVLILDGLDEVNLGDRQVQFLNELYNQLAQDDDIKKFSLMVTCRTNRIENFNELKSSYIILSPLSNNQIIEFSKNYITLREKEQVKLKATSIKKIKSILNLNGKNFSEVFQIPLILYMVLSLDIEVSEKSDLVQIYSQIFSVNNPKSIYLHREYTGKDHAVTKDQVEGIHKFSKEIAQKMWEIKPREASLERKHYISIADQIISNWPSIKYTKDLISNQYFIESVNGQELCFTHRSMYEYFVALSIADSLKALLQTDKRPDELYKECNPNLEYFLRLMSTSYILDDSNKEIKEYLIKILNTKNIEPSKVTIKWWQEFFEAFSLYTPNLFDFNKDKAKLDIIEHDSWSFYNILFISKELLLIYGKKGYLNLLSNKLLKTYINLFLENKNLSELDINNYELFGASLIESNLTRTNLVNANLTSANLSYANLSYANLSPAILTDANFNKADLSEAHLNHAKLRGATFTYANLKKAELEHVDLSSDNLTNADLTEAVLTDTHLINTNLSYANLSYAKLKDADLTCANLSAAKFIKSELFNTDFTGVTLFNNSVWNYTNIKGAKMSSKLREYALSHGAIEE